jgi:hypothetical protein
MVLQIAFGAVAGFTLAHKFGARGGARGGAREATTAWRRASGR